MGDTTFPRHQVQVILLQVLCQWDLIEPSKHHKPLTLFFVAVLAAFLML